MKSTVYQNVIRRGTNSRAFSAMGVLVVSLLSLSCTANHSKSQYADGYLSGYARACGYVIEEHFAGLYLPHVQALQRAEDKLREGIPAVEAVAGLDLLPGIKAVVVASSQTDSSFTLPDSYKLTPVAFQQLHPDSLYIKKNILPRGREMPVHNRLLGGYYSSRHINTPEGDETVLVDRGITGEGGKWMTIGYILDIDWLKKQIPARMDSLINQNLPLVLAKTNPAGGMFESDIAIYVTKPDPEGTSQLDPKDIIWSTVSYGKRETEVEANIWPFWDQMPIEIGVFYPSTRVK